MPALTRIPLIAAASVAALALAGCGSTGSTIGSMVSGNDDPFAVEIGDCVNESLLDAGSEETDSIPVVPCDEAHDSEVYAAVDVDYDSFPGADQLEADAAEFCHGEFEGFVGFPYDTSEIDFSYYIPTQGSWDELGDRELLCIAYDMAGQTTGSLADAGR